MYVHAAGANRYLCLTGFTNSNLRCSLMRKESHKEREKDLTHGSKIPKFKPILVTEIDDVYAAIVNGCL